MYDFEGDPQTHISERRIKRCPLRDVTSMLVSFGLCCSDGGSATGFGANRTRRFLTRALRNAARFWFAHVSAAFLRGYWQVAGRAAYMPASRADQQTLLQTYLLERALLDVRADIEDKPELAGMPLRIILYLIDAEADRNE